MSATGTSGGAIEDATVLTELVPDTPELLIDLTTVRANIERKAQMARDAGVALRPHVKTHKMPEIARLQVAAGAVGIQVAKLGEAEVMVDGGIQDIFVGYPIVGEPKLARLFDLAERATLSVGFDSYEVAAEISRVAQTRGSRIDVLLEIDTGLGRLGIAPGAATIAAAEQISALPGIELRGIFTHEGFVYTATRDIAEKERLTHEACRAMVETAEELRRHGFCADVVSVGSAGTFRFAITHPGITEVRPGTYVFNDRSQIAQGAATDADIGAFVVTTVVGRPAAERAIIDAGSKVLTLDPMLVPEPPRSFGRIWGHPDWDVVRLSEEHGTLSVPPDAELRVGDRLLIVPNHICPAINLANQVTVVERDVVVGRWPVGARGKVQ